MRSLLDVAVRALPGGGEVRDGQRSMAAAVADAIASGRHLVVQAGTGTGKSLAYLVPVLEAGKRTVIATATKALQDQLAGKDLPFVTAALGHELGREVSWAVLKGRSNYVCLQRVDEVTEGPENLLFDDAGPALRREVAALATWAQRSATGDRATLDREPSPRAWAEVSVSSNDCPGAARCPQGERCFAEQARRGAAEADVIVVNTHLYGLDVAAGGVILPEHDVVVIDEAHELEDIVSDTNGVELTIGRFVSAARSLGAVLEAPGLVTDLGGAGTLLATALEPALGTRLDRGPLPAAVTAALTLGRSRLDKAAEALRGVDSDVDGVKQRKLRAQRSVASLQTDIDLALTPADGTVSFVEGTAATPVLRVAPIDVGPVLAEGIWQRRPAILTSATIPLHFPARVGLPPEHTDELAVDSPFDYAHQSLLYCAMHLPDPRGDGYRDALHAELEALITAAGGRTLALFTSWRAMTAAAEALGPRLDVQVLTQSDMPKPRLISAFSSDETSVLFATAGFFQGIDVPGRALSLVTIDRIPFPRPDDPLLQARRDKIGAAAFEEIDIPRAAMLLAQAAGRLIRSTADRGVVAVLDRRLGTARYRWELVRALPPMRRTRHRAEAEAFLRDILAEEPSGSIRDRFEQT